MSNVRSNTAIPAFASLLDRGHTRTRDTLSVMQVNLGRLCNLSCKHCHMEAGPNRTETMARETLEACLRVLERHPFETVDLTGGAPEMNPHFRWFVEAARPLCDRLIVRTNLVILLEEGYTGLPEFFRDNRVEVVCSLPHFDDKNTDRMRGESVFARSIRVLQILNALGYGIDTDKPLHLVFNPGGAFLPGAQEGLEREFRRGLGRLGVAFTGLLAITNNPVGRFAAFLERSGNLDGYMEKLYGAFNPSTLENMMCRGQVSVAYDGGLYDCDFNQAAGLPLASGERIFDWAEHGISPRTIRFGQHCYACTAGQGSSCGGATES